MSTGFHIGCHWRGASAAACSGNPQDLTDVLSRLPAMKNHEVKELAPSRWKPRASVAV
jgi:hypothetical protein